jgi:hypothetical protein
MSFPPEVVVSIASVIDLKPTWRLLRAVIVSMRCLRERPSLSRRQTTRISPSRRWLSASCACTAAWPLISSLFRAASGGGTRIESARSAVSAPIVLGNNKHQMDRAAGRQELSRRGSALRRASQSRGTYLNFQRRSFELGLKASVVSTWLG